MQYFVGRFHECFYRHKCARKTNNINKSFFSSPHVAHDKFAICTVWGWHERLQINKLQINNDFFALIYYYFDFIHSFKFLFSTTFIEVMNCIGNCHVSFDNKELCRLETETQLRLSRCWFYFKARLVDGSCFIEWSLIWTLRIKISGYWIKLKRVWRFKKVLERRTNLKMFPNINSDFATFFINETIAEHKILCIKITRKLERNVINNFNKEDTKN